MTLRDVTTYGVYRILLVVNLVLPLLFLPILLIVNFIKPEALHINMESVTFLGMNVTMDIGNAILYPIVVLLFLINALIISSFQAIFVKILAKYTAIGKIRLGNKLRDTNPEVFS